MMQPRPLGSLRRRAGSVIVERIQPAYSTTRDIMDRKYLAIAALALGACADSGTAPGDLSTFDLIQREIFDTQCVSCHRVGVAFGAQSGLDLSPGRSHGALVNAQPTNAHARADGMLRVTPRNAERSLLYHKLQGVAHHHGRDYGAPMPLGAEPLFNGQVEFILRWIEAGAPRAGDVADVKLLEDRTRPSQEPFVALPVPARGFQLRIEPFAVKPQFERELFVLKSVGNTSDVYVNRIETKMRAGSHHLLVYTFAPTMPQLLRPQPNVMRDIRNPDGSLNLLNMATMAYHVFFAGAMTPQSDFWFPPGVALRLSTNAALDLNAHYVNRTSGDITGEAFVNLHTVPQSEVQQVARTLNLAHTDFSLPPNQRTTIRRTFMVGSGDLAPGADGTVKVVSLSSHMHERGERFVIRIVGGSRDGEIVYDNRDWAAPAIITYSPVLVLRAGEGLMSEVTFNNTTSRTIRFGLTSEDEMAIIFGYAY
jgi:mono/diheme cytochrome c family protein